jgi:Spy/CpxP family protein refolding chaperone
MLRAIIRTGFALAILGLLSLTAFAQDKTPATGAPATGPQNGPRHGGPGFHGEMGPGGPMMFMRQLNLTDAQRQQMRDVFVKFGEAVKPQMEELRQIREKFDQATATIEDQTHAQAIRKQLHESRMQAEAAATAVLTPEQQEQLKTLKEQMKQRREEMKQRRDTSGGQEAPAPQVQ